MRIHWSILCTFPIVCYIWILLFISIFVTFPKYLEKLCIKGVWKYLRDHEGSPLECLHALTFNKRSSQIICKALMLEFKTSLLYKLAIATWLKLKVYIILTSGSKVKYLLYISKLVLKLMNYCWRSWMCWSLAAANHHFDYS